MLFGGTIRTSITDHLGFNSWNWWMLLVAIFWCNHVELGKCVVRNEIYLLDKGKWWPKYCSKNVEGSQNRKHINMKISSFYFCLIQIQTWGKVDRSMKKLHLEMLRLQIHSPSFSLRYVHQRDWVSAMRVAEVPSLLGLFSGLQRPAQILVLIFLTLENHGFYLYIHDTRMFWVLWHFAYIQFGCSISTTSPWCFFR